MTCFDCGDRKECGLTATRRRTAGRNERLAEAMRDMGKSCADVAAAAGVDRKSARRWLYEGRRPRTRQKAMLVGRLLQADPAWLWPSLTPKLSTPDLACMYARLSDVPDQVWLALAQSARSAIDIATDTAPVLPVPELAGVLADRAAAGVRVRLCVGSNVEPVPVAGVQVRRCDQPEMLGIFRFDGAMLVWLNRGGPGMEKLGPVLHLTRSEDDGPFEAYEYVLRTLWNYGEPRRARAAQIA
jgi:hypothetical protein